MKKQNSGIFTAKAVNEEKKLVNTDYKSVFGAVKACVMSDALTHDGRKMLSTIANGAKYRPTKEFREILATQVLESSPLFAIVDGKQVACDRVCRTHEDGSRSYHYVVRKTWTIGKVFDCYAIAAGSKARKDVTALLEE